MASEIRPVNEELRLISQAPRVMPASVVRLPHPGLPRLTPADVPRDHVFERRIEISEFGSAVRHARAAALLADCERVSCVLDRRGLVLSAERDEDLDRPVALLRDAFGPALRSSAVRVRLREGAHGPEEPVLRVEVRCPDKYVESVRRDLERRGAISVETLDEGGCGIVRASLPAQCLVGYGRRFAQLTAGAGTLSMRLAHHVPVERDPRQPA